MRVVTNLWNSLGDIAGHLAADDSNYYVVKTTSPAQCAGVLGLLQPDRVDCVDAVVYARARSVTNDKVPWVVVAGRIGDGYLPLGHGEGYLPLGDGVPAVQVSMPGGWVMGEGLGGSRRLLDAACRQDEAEKQVLAPCP